MVLCPVLLPLRLVLVPLRLVLLRLVLVPLRLVLLRVLLRVPLRLVLVFLLFLLVCVPVIVVPLGLLVVVLPFKKSVFDLPVVVLLALEANTSFKERNSFNKIGMDMGFVANLGETQYL